MTVTYTSEVATLTGLGVFWKLLLRWKGSIYKLIWKEVVIYISLYFIIKLIYLFGLPPENRRHYKGIVLYCRSYSASIPLSFVLGFYVNLVMTRWWAQYESIPWPDSLAVYVSNLVQGMDERGRLMRRTILRYVNLSSVITLTMISPRVKKRFPTLEHLVEAGFLMVSEKKIFENLNKKFTHSLYWMPLVWAGSIVTRGRQEGRIKDDFSVKTLLDTINTYRSGLGGLLNYDMISIPLVYTQVVTLAIYAFFASTLLGSQFLLQEDEENKDSKDYFLPWFTLLQYLFYVGWLKVAESLVNPFGEDDDDFELNWLIDRNIQVSYLIVDEMHNEHPELIQDKYWDEIFPCELPYTVATENYKKGPPLGSTINMDIPRHEQLFVRYDEEFENESDVGISTPGNRRKFGPDDVEAPCSPTSLKLSAITEERTGNRNIPIYGDIWTTVSNVRNHSSGFLSHLRMRRQTSTSIQSQASSASLKGISHKSMNTFNHSGKSPDEEIIFMPPNKKKKENNKVNSHISLGEQKEEDSNSSEEKDSLMKTEAEDV